MVVVLLSIKDEKESISLIYFPLYGHVFMLVCLIVIIFNNKNYYGCTFYCDGLVFIYIDKSENIRNMNSQNSLDLSYLSQGYVCYKLTEIQLNNEIKDSFNSKLRHKKRPDSFMNHWTNWLKLHYQYHLPKNRWSRLVSENGGIESMNIVWLKIKI